MPSAHGLPVNVTTVLRLREAGAFLTSFTGDSLRARFARGALWSLVGAITAQGLSLVASVVTARLLSAEGFGALGMIQSTVGMFGTFAGLGLGLTATKHVAQFRMADPDRAGRVVGLTFAVAVLTGGVVSALLCLGAPVLAESTINAPHLTRELRVGSVLLLLNTLAGIQIGVLAGFEAFKTVARLNLLRGLLAFPITIAGALLWALPGAVWALVATAGVGVWLNRSALRGECAAAGVRVSLWGAWQERKVLWDFSIPAFLSGALVGPVTWLANTLLVNQPNGYAEMGVFNAASQWRSALLFVPGSIGQTAVPILSSLCAAGDKRRSRKAVTGAIALCAACATPTLLVLLLLKDHIMGSYGSGFSRRGPVLATTCVTGALLAIQTPVGHLITAMGRMWLGALMNAGWAAVLLVCAAAFLARRWGADGLAYSYLCAYTVHATWTFAFAARALSRAPANKP